MTVAAVVLAAGKGTRMHSKIPKVIHPICGRPMVEHVVNNLREAGIGRIIVVIGHNGQAVKDTLGPGIEYVVQEEQLGTGHAVMQTETVLKNHNGPLMVIHGDTPLYRPATLRALVHSHRDSGVIGTVLAVNVDDPTGYGRIVRNAAGGLDKIVEQKDADPIELEIREINSGTYVFECESMFAALRRIRPQNVQNEYYLTDVLTILKEDHGTVQVFTHADDEEALGINNRAQLAVAEQIMRDRIREKWLLAGVTMIDPATTYIDAEAELEQDVALMPFTFIEGHTHIAQGSVIGPFVRLKDAKVGENVTISQATVVESSLERGCTVGPYSHIRPGCHLAEGVKVGGFCEIKNTIIGPESKVPHLSYLGDTRVGGQVNIGAGTITCNYDGLEKHRTTIEDQAFIGSNCNLVAPVVVGTGAYAAAGSTITTDIPPGALGVARNRQRNIPGWEQRQQRKREEPKKGS
ncbi:MAG: bifunctional UDP-N-acetylglucosamine diphosphorylase/glucosamine-1-phosphate N-acetyltransferase GlmU [Firmicutes bacterium]|nr:bifunctional UDP-N-acetylglucosamine diphosphorylase/glucosamine-1-phosphate N-acetyltransferase GlmU [Bacillota bacterium]